MPARPNPERDEKIKKLWNQGLTSSVIGVRLGINTDSVRVVARRLGLEKKTPKPDWS